MFEASFEAEAISSFTRREEKTKYPALLDEASFFLEEASSFTRRKLRFSWKTTNFSLAVPGKKKSRAELRTLDLIHDLENVSALDRSTTLGRHDSGIQGPDIEIFNLKSWRVNRC